MDVSAILLDQNPWWSDSNYRETRRFLSRRPVFSKLLEYAGNGHEDRAVLLIGPRQVGKTTLLLQLADELLDREWPPGNLIFFDFADERLVATLSPRDIVNARPPGLTSEHPRVFLLDEIQYAAGWARWLKAAIDQARRGGAPIRFIVTGSAAASLRDGAVESGQGRWDEVSLEGLTFSEFLALGAGSTDQPARLAAREPQAFDRYLALGGLPEHVRSPSPRETRQRIRDDIAERAILRDLRGAGVEIERVRRLFVHLVNGSGNEWNQSNRAADLDADRKSLTDWLALLESTHLLVRLERDHTSLKRARTQLRSRPKIFAADHGLITAFSPHAEPLEVSEVLGRVYEAVVFRHLRELARENRGELSFFRLNDDLEVDFVIRYSRVAVGIEVTSSPEARPDKLARTGEAMRKAGIERKLLLHGGLTMTRAKDLDIVPLHEFLLAPGRYAGSEP
ncbi:MAG TPA: ATP-binding protein [Polyangia bacterium]|nr:ATP-binding protein [Polyangia bacterium]